MKEAGLLAGFFVAELLVIAADQLGVLGWDRITIDGNEGIALLAAREFLGQARAHIIERASDLRFHDRPLGRFAVALEILAHRAGPITDARDFVAQIRNI